MPKYLLTTKGSFFKSFCAHAHSKQNVKCQLGRVYCGNFSIAVGQMYSYNALDFCSNWQEGITQVQLSMKFNCIILISHFFTFSLLVSIATVVYRTAS